MLHRLRNYFRTPDLTLVAASDTSHAKSLLNFLASAQRHEPETRVVIYDLGMTEAELVELRSRFGYEVRTFDFGKYPAFFDIRVAAGEYAWKSQLIRDVALETREILCWMDAGTSSQNRFRDSAGKPAAPGTIVRYRREPSASGRIPERYPTSAFPRHGNPDFPT